MPAGASRGCPWSQSSDSLRGSADVTGQELPNRDTDVQPTCAFWAWRNTELGNCNCSGTRCSMPTFTASGNN